MKSKNVLKRVGIVGLGIFFSTFLHASNAYPVKTVDLLDNDGKPLGKVTTATELAVIKTLGEKTQVRINGWSAYGAETIIFKTIGKRIILALLNDKAIKSIKKGKTQQDEYEAEWNESSIVGWVKTSDLTKEKDAIWTKANQLFTERCGGCHQSHPPHEFTANQWPNILKAMKDRAGLTSDDQWLLTKFMQNHAKDME
jgi:nitrate/TMAO reductase-like tetraheme cytochrome c subunit